MRNPFVSMALAAAAIAASLRNNMLIDFQRGVNRAAPPTATTRKNGGTVAQAKRAAIKAKNRAKHRRACRGAR